MVEEESLGSDDDLVAVALRLLWDLDAFLADAAADRLKRLAPAQRAALIDAIDGLREALTCARSPKGGARDTPKSWSPRKP